MRATPVIALSLALAATALAQSPTSQDLGTVTGHVICNDTQHPARLADVRLVPVTITLPTDAKSSGFSEFSAIGNSLPAVETDMSGAYTIHNVRPGQYYLRIDLPGYITPLPGAPFMTTVLSSS